jgi:predicted GIY-YIG superfamily endonuclease
LETLLNGGTPLVYSLKASSAEQEENPVPNRILAPKSIKKIVPRKQPGLYMIRCVANDYRYYGESGNVSARLSSHRSLLNNKIHPNKCLQHDWNLFGQENFEFQVLFMSPEWDLKTERCRKEIELCVLDTKICYNILKGHSNPQEKNPFWGRVHTPEAKAKIGAAMRGRPNDLLGKTVSIKGTCYPSIAEASRQTGEARKTIRKKLNDPDISNFFF